MYTVVIVPRGRSTIETVNYIRNGFRTCTAFAIQSIHPDHKIWMVPLYSLVSNHSNNAGQCSKNDFFFAVKTNSRILDNMAQKSWPASENVLFCFSFRILLSRTRIVLFVVERCREVHASTQPEWICVQHGLVLSHELIGIAVVSGRSILRWIVARHVVRARGYRLWGEARDVRGIDGAVMVIINEIGLCVVLLFWPWSVKHSLGWNEQKEGRGIAHRVGHNVSGMEMGNRQPPLAHREDREPFPWDRFEAC